MLTDSIIVQDKIIYDKKYAKPGYVNKAPHGLVHSTS